MAWKHRHRCRRCVTARAAAREAGADLIVAVGGGSAMVTARAIIILLAEKGDIHEICTQYPPGQAPVSPKLMAPKIPNILVLTTPSTAMTRAGTAVMDIERSHRLELFDPKTRPFAMIWDDDALLTAPADLYLSTAASALSGILASTASPRINPLSLLQIYCTPCGFRWRACRSCAPIRTTRRHA